MRPHAVFRTKIRFPHFEEAGVRRGGRPSIPPLGPGAPSEARRICARRDLAAPWAANLAVVIGEWAPRPAAGVALHGSARRRALAKGLSHGGRDLVAVDGERAVGVGASSLSPRKRAPGSARLGPSDALMCWGASLVERRGRSGRGARHGPRAIVGGDRGRGRGIDGSSRASAVVGALRSIEGSAGCVSQSRQSGDHARSRRSLDFSGGVSLGRPDTSVCPLGFVASLSLADRPRNGGPRLFSADAGAVHFLTGASAGSFFLAPDIFASRSKKVGVSPSFAPLRPAPPPDGRRTWVQARSHGQAFRDRTEGNKPASGRRNPRPRKSGSRS